MSFVGGYNGDIKMLSSLVLEIMLVRPGSVVPFLGGGGNWLHEEVIIRHPAQGVAGFSGSLMREPLFFFLEPARVSDDKGGLNAII